MPPIQCGLDVFLRERGGPWRGKRAGLIVHQASVTSGLVPAVEALVRNGGVRLAALFAPEHGWTGALQDQVSVPAAREPLTGLPVRSLYGPHRVPSPAALRGLDVLLFDLQDIGVRYYTFIWTMALAMGAAGRAGIPFVVLDRPNPIGGDIIEGNLPDPAYASFVGLHPLPVRHGMTCGELALYLNETHRLGSEVHVVRARGWRRSLWQDRTDLPWVAPSPNMPTLDTATVYAGGCLLEATNLSEGRGTTRPFEIVGAPFIDGPALARALNEKDLPGVIFRPCGFQPAFHKWAGQPCGGVQAHVVNREKYPSFLSGLVLLQAVRRLWPRAFRWRPPPYEFERRRPPIDVLCGTDAVRRAIEADEDVGRLASSWRRDEEAFRRRRRPFLLYPPSA